MSGPPVSQTEPSITAAVKNLLFNGDFSDVTLRASDGVELKANRCILAARSSVFQRMLFGKFSEASSAIVDVGFEGEILKVVVEYIYTNKVATKLDTLPENATHSDLFDTASSLAPLENAASYFNLNGMIKEIVKVAERTMAKFPAMALFVWEACCDGNSGLGELALGMIRANPTEVITEKLLPSLDVSTLEAFLKDDRMNASELTLFQMLQTWANTKDAKDVVRCGEKRPLESTAETTRKSKATLLAKHIRLELISPKDLSTTITSSDLVTKDELFEAYRVQAQKGEDENSVVYTAPRYSGVPRWEHVKSDIFAAPYQGRRGTVSHPGMRGGVHRWTVRILQMPSGMPMPIVFLGVKCLSKSRPPYYWSFSNQGTLWQNLKLLRMDYKVPSFAKGDEITLRLDLDSHEEDSNGTLTASINGGFPVVLFRKINDLLKQDDCSSIFPVAELHPATSIRLVRVQEL